MYYISPGTGLLNDSPSPDESGVGDESVRALDGLRRELDLDPQFLGVNEARVGYSHYYQSFLSDDATRIPANYNFNGSTYSILHRPDESALFRISRTQHQSGFSGALGASWPKIVGPNGVLQIIDHISYLRGKHAFKFGGEILNNQSTSNVTANTKGPITFDSLQDFFNGFPNGPPQACSQGRRLAQH